MLYISIVLMNKIGDIVSSDPYVVMKCGHQTVKTKVVYNSLNPVFNEMLMLCTTGHDDLAFEVWDHDSITAHDLLGKATLKAVDLRGLITGDTPNVASTLKLDTQGTLTVDISFNAIDH
jgi:stromal membrane-associated protein